MRHLGLDYGEKRIGIAVSDPEGKIAFPKEVIFNKGNKKVFAKLKSLINEEKISKIVIGLPISLGGQETGQTKEMRNFTDFLKKAIDLPVEFENEMFTTKITKQGGVKKEYRDASAAAIILQSYLDKENSKFKDRNAK